MSIQNDLLLIIGSACTALVFIQSGIPFAVRRWMGLRRMKPFDCEFCLSFWLGLAASIYFEKNVVETIYISAIASVVAVFVNKNLNR